MSDKRTRSGYAADGRLQITAPDEDVNMTNGVAVHEDRGDGTPLCGTQAKVVTAPGKHQGVQLIFTPMGSGTVDCGLCGRIHTGGSGRATRAPGKSRRRAPDARIARSLDERNAARREGRMT